MAAVVSRIERCRQVRSICGSGAKSSRLSVVVQGFCQPRTPPRLSRGEFACAAARCLPSLNLTKQTPRGPATTFNTMWILPLLGYVGIVLGFAFLTLAIGRVAFLPPSADPQR
jgi:hypothetical protein